LRRATAAFGETRHTRSARDASLSWIASPGGAATTARRSLCGERRPLSRGVGTIGSCAARDQPKTADR
jgi:hypothetical protein